MQTDRAENKDRKLLISRNYLHQLISSNLIFKKILSGGNNSSTTHHAFPSLHTKFKITLISQFEVPPFIKEQERKSRYYAPASAYLFILVLEILFLFIKNHPETKGIEIFEQCFLYTAYADDTAFFLKDAQSIENLVEIFNTLI